MTEPICCTCREVQPQRISEGSCKGAKKIVHGLRFIGQLPKDCSFDSSQDKTITFWRYRPALFSPPAPTFADRKIAYDGYALNGAAETKLYITKLGKGRYQLEPQEEGKFAPVSLTLAKPKKVVIPQPPSDQQPWECEIALTQEIVRELKKLPRLEGTLPRFVFKDEVEGKRVVAIDLNQLPEAYRDDDQSVILSKVTLPVHPGEEKSLLLLLRWRGHCYAMRRIVAGKRVRCEASVQEALASASIIENPSKQAESTASVEAKTSCLKRWWNSFTSLFFTIFPFLKRNTG